MTNREEAAKLVKAGNSPSAAATMMKTSVNSIRLYLLQQIAEDKLRKSDVVRSIDEKTKSAYEAFIKGSESQDYWSLVNGTKKKSFDFDQFRLYLECRNSLRGELYTRISDLEVFLHDKIQKSLMAEFGADESGWWREGVPDESRVQCVTTRECVILEEEQDKK